MDQWNQALLPLLPLLLLYTVKSLWKNISGHYVRYTTSKVVNNEYGECVHNVHVLLFGRSLGKQW